MSNKKDNIRVSQSGNYKPNVVYSYGNREFNANSDVQENSAISIKHEHINNSVFATIKYCYINYFNFSGRASRFEYWSFTIFWGIIGVICNLAIILLELVGLEIVDYVLLILINIIAIINIIPSLAVSWRRMHDIDYSGWMSLTPIIFASFAAIILVIDSVMRDKTTWQEIEALSWLVFIVCQIYLFCQPGDPNPNKYGDPVK